MCDALDRVCILFTTGDLRRGFVFFFQAEDGIRDLVRSRGLGDVYKRQGVKFAGGEPFTADDVIFSFDRVRTPESEFKTRVPVSYTHLTLPTSDLV